MRAEYKYDIIGVSLSKTLQLATMFPTSQNTTTLEKGPKIVRISLCRKFNNEMEKKHQKKISGKVKYNLKIENRYIKKQRTTDILKSFLKYANY